MTAQQAEGLIDRYNKGIATAEEVKLVENWYIQESTKQDATLPEDVNYLQVKQRVWNNLERITYPSPKKIVRLWPRIVAVAAMTVIVFGATIWYYTNNRNTDNGNLIAHDIAPGKNGATLTLANGKKIYINEALSGNIATESGVKISKTADGQIIYQVTENKNNELLAYNTLTTTRGEQTQVRLPDGTLVFLNAESSLKYPNNFTKSKNRTVTLTGEGYFEVSKDKSKPFIVDTRLQAVEVLGTHFNINSYSENAKVKTTLLEGSVKVSNLHSHVSKILMPSQQASVTEQSVDISSVEVEDAVAWKNGRLMYEGETLENILKDVSRWYNVEVVFNDEASKNKVFFASVSRWDKLSKLLKIMERSKSISFEIKGNQVFVNGKKN